ncbi:MAG: cytochrome c maturation protein CcmE [Candidatus Marinimicrobia bacterium]|nr:cytochrome c maturation protein CcmE [Candidatus Neomarinimicrobiota bacterium]
MNKGIKITAGILIIVATIIYWTFQSLDGNEIYYMTVKDLKSSEFVNADSRVKLGGLVKAGTINKITPMSVKFQIKQDSCWINVSYEGIIPDMFKDEAEVIIEGKYIEGEFVADNLIAKCASKYETNFEHQEENNDKPQKSEG